MTYESYMMLSYICAGLSTLMLIVSVILFCAIIKGKRSSEKTNMSTDKNRSSDTVFSQDIKNISFDIPGFSIEQAIMIINTDEKIDM